MTIVCAAFLGSVLLAAPRVGVVVVGEDAGAAGDLQRAIELRLSANKKFELAGATELGAALPPAPPRPSGARPIDPALVKEAAAAYVKETKSLGLGRAPELNQ